MIDVDFVINVFERNYRESLKPGNLRSRVAKHCYPFRRIVVLVNNVDNKDHIQSMLDLLLASGEITDTYFISDYFDRALSISGLTRNDLGDTVNYTNCSLVAVTLPGSPYVCYCDADIFLEKPVDWITPSLELMQADPRIAVANPDWIPSSLSEETRETSGDFALGYGFSDQIYLVRREEFSQPIYKYFALISLRYPLWHRAAIYEHRVDAYMRCCKRLRATYTKAAYRHDSDEGAGYSRMGKFDRWKVRLARGVMRLAAKLPGDNPRYHM